MSVFDNFDSPTQCRDLSMHVKHTVVYVGVLSKRQCICISFILLKIKTLISIYSYTK